MRTQAVTQNDKALVCVPKQLHIMTKHLYAYPNSYTA